MLIKKKTCNIQNETVKMLCNASDSPFYAMGMIMVVSVSINIFIIRTIVRQQLSYDSLYMKLVFMLSRFHIDIPPKFRNPHMIS